MTNLNLKLYLFAKFFKIVNDRAQTIVQSKYIWESVADGTVERIFETLKNRAVGFGGVTIIGGGNPLPFIELLSFLLLPTLIKYNK